MPHADIGTDGRIVVSITWSERELIKQIPGCRWNADDKEWSVPRSWAACQQLRGIFKDKLTIGAILNAWVRVEKQGRVFPAMALRSLIDLADGEAYTGNDKLRVYQQAGVRFLQAADSAILADEMGTGKTIQGLEWLRQTEDALPALVVCPNSLKGNWRKEAQIWFPECTPYEIRGSAAARRKIFASAAADATALVIINFEGLRGHSRLSGFGSIALKRCGKCEKGSTVKEAQCETCSRELNTMPFKSIIVDEAHRMKDPKSKQTRALWAIGRNPTVTHRIPMTGTPVANNAGDMWSLFHFVSPLEFPTKSRYVDRYCLAEFNRWGGLDVTGLNPATKDELFKIIEPRFRRTPKALVLRDLPAKIRQSRFVTLTPGQMKAYKQLENTACTRLPDGTLMIPKKLITVHQRLMQLTSATLEGDGTEHGIRMVDPSSKLDAMEELWDEMNGRSLVVCADSRQLIELSAKRFDKLKVPYAMITGKVPQWDREAQLAQFQAGKLPVMLFTIKAGGVGLTMTASDTICFLQRSWSMLENLQAEDRVHRIGAEHHSQINVVDLIAEGTIEEGQIDALWVKRARLDEINRDRETLTAAGLDTNHLDKEAKEILDD